MKSVEIDSVIDANITQMRDGAAFGNGNAELLDGNMIPRLCQFAGENACAQTCQLKELKAANPEAGSAEAGQIGAVGKLCAENNIVETLASRYISPENAVLVSATKDRVVFADEIDQSGAFRHPDGYTMVPEANGFFFRPGKDMTVNGHRRLYEAMMRMADCGDVIVIGTSKTGEPFVGQGHFSRTNMRGPSAYKHELDGRKVSWGEYFIGSAIEHYDADPSSLRVTLVAAVEREDFVHHYENKEKMEAHFPGWNELGFMHPAAGKDEDFDCMIDYREMIAWQLTEGIQNPKYRLAPEQVNTAHAINTGDLSLGHASHHKATHGEIAHGRDIYAVGLNRQQAVAARIAEVERLRDGQEWTMRSFPEMSDKDYDAFAALWANSNRELAHLKAIQQTFQGERAQD